MAEVSIVHCEKYDMETAEAALLQVLEPLGGLDWVKSGMRVAIKANLVSFLKPEAAATTHPVLLCALTKLLVQRGAQVVVGDSPGGLYTPAYVNRVYAATGVGAVEEFGGRLNRNFEQKTAHFPEAIAAKTFQYTAYLDEADAIINFCKLKSHGMMGLSAAVKNLFGVGAGHGEAGVPFPLSRPHGFCRHAAGSEPFISSPELCIVDAVVAMEGNGPTAGNAPSAGSAPGRAPTPSKLDLVCARRHRAGSAAGADAGRRPWRAACFCRRRSRTARGLARRTLWRRISTASRTASAPSSTPSCRAVLGKIFGGVAKGSAGLACLRCGRGSAWAAASARVSARPTPSASKNRIPHIDRSVCIRCFCCQEFCPKGAMKVRRPLLAKILNR